MKLNKILAGLLAASLATMSVNGIAATDTATLNISATAVTACSFGASTYSMDFGNYDGTAIATQQTDISFTCGNATVPFKLEANDGSNFDGVSGDRRMINGSNYLTYDLFRDSGRTQRLGLIADNEHYESTTGTAGSTTTVTIYGAMQSGQAIPAAGAYSDTVTLTLTF